jgi:hypothetical protein
MKFVKPRILEWHPLQARDAVDEVPEAAHAMNVDA